MIVIGLVQLVMARGKSDGIHVYHKIPTYSDMINEPRCEKTGLLGFRPGSTQIGLYSHRRWLEACNFLSRK